MSFLWSKQASHILSLYAPWKPDDAVPIDSIDANEQRIGYRIPALLRHFYLSWGIRHDMNQSREYLHHPQELRIQTEALLFCSENQGVLSWSILCNDIRLPDPPVYVAYNEETDFEWELSHTHLSSFLDALTYHHAFAGGSVCGATTLRPPNERQIADINTHLTRISLEAPVWGLTRWQNQPEYIYVSPRIAVTWDPTALYVAATTTTDLASVKHMLDVEWKDQW